MSGTLYKCSTCVHNLNTWCRFSVFAYRNAVVYSNAHQLFSWFATITFSFASFVNTPWIACTRNFLVCFNLNLRSYYIHFHINRRWISLDQWTVPMLCGTFFTRVQASISSQIRKSCILIVNTQWLFVISTRNAMCLWIFSFITHCCTS